MQILLSLLTLFVTVPLVELILLLILADRTHWGVSIGLVILTGLAGTALARSQGTRVLAEIRERSAAGQVPGSALLDGMLILIAGALLITPGILTDVFGFSLLVPACRRFYRSILIRRFKSRFQVDQFSSFAGRPGEGPGEGEPWPSMQDEAFEAEPPAAPQGTTIDSYVVRSDDQRKQERTSDSDSPDSDSYSDSEER